MSLESEDRIGEIVDIDTFTYGVVEYTSGVMQHAPRRPIARDIWNRRFMMEPVSGLSVERFLENPYPVVRIEQFPWDGVPESIKNVIRQQFICPDDPGEQFIDVTITRRDVVFALYNNYISGRINTFSEEYVGRGLLLLFGQEPDDSIIKRGNWRIVRFPMSLVSKAKYIVNNAEPPPLRNPDALQKWAEEQDEMEDVQNRLEALLRSIPVTLEELQDVMRLLEKGKGLAVVYEPEETI